MCPDQCVDSTMTRREIDIVRSQSWFRSIVDGPLSRQWFETAPEVIASPPVPKTVPGHGTERIIAVRGLISYPGRCSLIQTRESTCTRVTG